MTSTSLTPQQRRLAIIAGGVGAVLLLLYLIAVLSSGSTARSGTMVGPVDISGMTADEAIAAVAAGAADSTAKPLRVTADGKRFKVDPEQAGLVLDAAASVAPAYGRTWSPVSLLTAPFSTQRLNLVASVDEEALAAEVTQLADTVATDPVEPRIIIRKGTPKVKEGASGRELDVEATVAAMQEAFLSSRRAVEATMVDVAPSISAESTQQALELAQAATSSPVTIQADAVRATLTGRDIGNALSFSAQGSALVPSLNGAKLHRAVRDQLAAIETPGRDATFRIKGGVPRVVSSKVGKGVEDDELATAVASVMGNPGGDRTATVTVGVREPKLTTAQALELGVREKLSSFTQSYPYAAYRSQNIGQAAKRIDGTLLLPGETFSLNDTILERTKENGYTVGYVVGVGGVFREDMGGGVSTSATATWTAGFFAGMERVQTVAHSIWISRYEAGLEATVAWGIFDLKFRNPYSTAVYIQAKTTPTSITVSFWGTPEYDKIEAQPQPRTSVVKYKKIYDETPECRTQSGVDGFTIVVDRVFYKDGAEVNREPITTRYKPAPQVICGENPKKKNDKKPGKKGQDEFAAEDASASPSPDPSESASSKPKDDPSASPSSKPKDDPSASPSSKPGKKPSQQASSDPDVFSN